MTHGLTVMSLAAIVSIAAGCNDDGTDAPLVTCLPGHLPKPPRRSSGRGSRRRGGGLTAN